MTARYFVADLPDGGGCRLEGAEAHHLLHVMRAQVGDEVELFDGRGRCAAAAVEAATRREVRLRVLSIARRSLEPSLPLHLGVALPKGDRQKWLAEKCVELGVASLTPLNTTRGVAQPSAKTLQRLERAVIEASKQCGRNHLMPIHQPASLADWLQPREPSAETWFAHPADDAKSIGELLRSRARTGGETPLRIALGPEGGFHEDERKIADANNARPVKLGPRILRIETAAMAVASACLMLAED